jgi:short-subunit dehydrogenase
MNGETALITGSSSGIGLHLAHEFAKHGHPLVLTAPVEGELQQLADELRRDHNVEVRVIAKDLEQERAAEELFQELERAGVTVDILVNNAGHGQTGKFWEIPLERHMSIIRLNVDAVVRMTSFFLPPMIQRGHGHILNTASVAGFEAGPLLAVYHASKAFVLSLTEALRVELEESGVTVTALCPGPTDTDFFPKADMIDTVAFQKANLMAPQPVAEAGYKGLMDGDPIVVPGGINKTLVFARRFLTESAQAKLNKKFYQETSPEDRKRERGDLETAEARER